VLGVLGLGGETILSLEGQLLGSQKVELMMMLLLLPFFVYIIKNLPTDNQSVRSAFLSRVISLQSGGGAVICRQPFSLQTRVGDEKEKASKSRPTYSTSSVEGIVADPRV